MARGMSNDATQDAPAAGVGASVRQGTAISAGIAIGQRVLHLLERIARGIEGEPDIDTCYVVGGTYAAAGVLDIQLPRTVRHAEIELSVGTSTPNVFAAVFDGPVDVVTAGNRHNPAAAGSSSGAIVVSNGNTAKCRDYLTGSGHLTVYFTGAATIYANVRVRDLDRTQTRARRT